MPHTHAGLASGVYPVCIGLFGRRPGRQGGKRPGGWSIMHSLTGVTKMSNLIAPDKTTAAAAALHYRRCEALPEVLRDVDLSVSCE
ncbi:hypothetical protein ElyMa_002669400 [Elysia marginata]|uniref:Uncharacterized protein n=1 Tax=Elysia marginata TaxID=1093978 RepID=A0AAV4HBN8_9GAST|nr:hypothetical protein ElyMa_002669400 [Elysia marginata]